MSAVHPQVAALLERAAKSPLPAYYDVPPAVARRLYRDTRGALTPDPPAVESAQLLMAPGKAGPVPVRAYRPKGAGKDEVLPALVYFHGGGWVIGDLDTHDVVCRTLANGARCAVFSVEYRKAPEAPFPAPVDDCFSALSFVFSNSNSLKINAKQVAVGGDSAGGNLATVVALMARDASGAEFSSPISFQVLIYPGCDQRMGHASIDRNGEGYLLTKKSMLYFRGHYLPNEKDRLDWRASPLLAKSLNGLPPAFLLTAGFDPLVDEGREYAERMQKDGVKVEYKNFPDMVHGFITMGRVLETANAALADCAQALKKAWGI
jgi:acetyl esterase